MSARFWYYPNGTGGILKSVNLQRLLTARSGPTYSMDQVIQLGYNGQAFTTHLFGLQRISLRYRFEGLPNALTSDLAVVRRQLVGIINHLQRGGWVTFAENYNYAWAAFFSTLPGGNVTTLSLKTDNLMPNLIDRLGGLSLVGKEVYLQADPATSICEMAYVSVDAHRTGNVTLNEHTAFSFTSAAWGMVRERGSYPALRLVPQQRNTDMLQTESDTEFTLALELEEDPTRYSELAGIGGLPAPPESGGVQDPTGGLDQLGQVGNLPGWPP